MEERLKESDYGIAEVVGHYMRTKQWAKALPYAKRMDEASARLIDETDEIAGKPKAIRDFPEAGLLHAAQCHEALQHWDEAEQCYRNCAFYQQSSIMDWYFFCRRTGQGDVEGARKSAQSHITAVAQAGGSFGMHAKPAFYVLERDPEKALSNLGLTFEQVRDPWTEIWMALLADQLNDIKRRDDALGRAKDKVVKAIAARNPAFQGPRGAAMMGLVTAIANDLASGGKGKIDLDATNKLAVGLPTAEHPQFH